PPAFVAPCWQIGFEKPAHGRGNQPPPRMRWKLQHGAAKPRIPDSLLPQLSASGLEVCQSSFAKQVLIGRPFYGGTNDTICLGRSSDVDCAVISARNRGPCGRCQCGG